MRGKMQFPKANTSPSVKTITWVCLLYIIEQCWRESLDAKTSLSCPTTLAHVLNEKVMALKRCQHHETAIFRCGLETVKKPCRIPWIALVFHASGSEVSSGIFSIWRKSQWRLVDGGPCPLTPHFKERGGILHKPSEHLESPQLPPTCPWYIQQTGSETHSESFFFIIIIISSNSSFLVKQMCSLIRTIFYHITSHCLSVFFQRGNNVVNGECFRGYQSNHPVNMSDGADHNKTLVISLLILPHQMAD